MPLSVSSSTLSACGREAGKLAVSSAIRNQAYRAIDLSICRVLSGALWQPTDHGVCSSPAPPGILAHEGWVGLTFRPTGSAKKQRAGELGTLGPAKFSTDYNGSMRFEWERKKFERNVRKHGVSLEEAITAFYDPLAVTLEDPDDSIEELRFITFGCSAHDHLLVIAQVAPTGSG